MSSQSRRSALPLETGTRGARTVVPIVMAAFGLSGASSLIFELVWLYKCSLLLGNTAWATSVVLSSFMGGLALGSALSARFAAGLRRPLRVYAAAELVLAVTGVALTYVLTSFSGSVAPLISALLDTRWLLNVTRLAITGLLLLVPTTVMGTTLPVLVQALRRSSPSFARVLGWLYGVNTCGAVLGVVTLELALIDRVGIVGSAWIAALFGSGAAALALWGESRLPVAAVVETPAPRAAAGQLPVRLLVCASLMGATLMALEVVWFRFLSMFTVASTLAASLMLASVLGAMALGGLLASAWFGSERDPSRWFPVVILAAVSTLVVSYWSFQHLTSEMWAAETTRIIWAAVVLTAPTAMLSGIGFVLLTAALKSRGLGTETRVTGWVTAANTAGGVLGPLMASFVLLPMIGMERSVFALAWVYVVTAGLAVLTLGFPRSAMWRTAGAGVALVAIMGLALFPFGLMARTYFARATREYTADGSTVLATREGVSETIHLLARRWLEKPLYFRLVTNGFSMSGTHVSGKRYMRYFAYLPMLLHDGPLRRALVVCYGAGVTADAVTSIDSVQSIDVAEISPDIAAMSPLIHGPERDPLRDPRVRLHLEDGRFFLEATRDRFDLITAEPPPPLTPGTVSLYTKEQFQLVHDRLAEGGIATYWLPVARRGEYDVRAVVSAFCQVFQDCSLWNGTVFDWMLLGTRGASGPVSASAFAAPWSDPRMFPRLRESGFDTPEQIGATFLADSTDLRQMVAGVEPLTDDRPQRLRPAPGRLSVTHRLPREEQEAADFIAGVADPTRARAAFARSPFIRGLWPAGLVPGTLEMFDVQRLLNDVMRDGAHPLAQIGPIHRLLTQTSLRRAPLWLLGSDDAQQEAADPARDPSGMADYVIGIRALVARQYEVAAESFADAQRRGLTVPTLTPLLAFALCLSGHVDVAGQIAASVRPTEADEVAFWSWLQATFHLLPDKRHAS